MKIEYLQLQAAILSRSAHFTQVPTSYHSATDRKCVKNIDSSEVWRTALMQQYNAEMDAFERSHKDVSVNTN